MHTQNLDKIFDPKRIAVVGASDEPDSRGSLAMRNLIGEGYDRLVYPVNPDRESVHGIHAYRSVADLPRVPDLAVVCTEAHETPQVVAECGAAGILGMVILSRGFSETGPEGAALEKRIHEEAGRYPQMRIIGPNSYGIIVPELRLNASLARQAPKEGRLAFISQSKGLCASTLDWALKDQVGFSYFVSLGNVFDVGFSELIDYFAEDARTLGLILYVVSIRRARTLMSAARAFSRNRPIVAFKSGRFTEGAEPAAFHTAAMAGEDAVYDAAFQRAGIVRVSQIEDIFDCAELLARQRTPRGARLAVITNAREPGVAAADALLARDGTLASLSEDTIQQLGQLLPSNVPPDNPAKLPRNATPDQYCQATRLLIKDPKIDAVLVILTPRRMSEPTGTAEAVSSVAAESDKPVLAAWMGGQAVQPGIQVLNRAGVSAYSTPEQAIRAFMYLVSYARNKEILYETPRDIPVSFTPDRAKIGDLLHGHPHDLLSECDSKALLDSYQIPVTQPELAHSAEEAVQIARRIGPPVVLKILSPQITHKHEVSGVSLDLRTEEGVRIHFEQICANAHKLRPDAEIEGVTVQKMVVEPSGVELILGAKKDPTFGSAIMVGMGGFATQIIHDRALGLPPLNERLARRMLESLKAWPLLQGYRGRPAVNSDRLIEILMRLSYLVADHPEIKELDINPLLVTPKDAVALDARVRIDRERVGQEAKPYAHLAIRPYPKEYVRSETLRDGTPVVLRPIKPEDEPLWQDMLARCSDESIRRRFRALFKRTSHEVATRHCFVDYDRDMTIVAEVRRNGTPTVVGVVSLFSDAKRESAEYAILVADDSRRNGLGDLLTAYCVEVATNWGLKRLYAETALDNRPMIALFAKRGFQVHRSGADETVLANNALGSDDEREETRIGSSDAQSDV